MRCVRCQGSGGEPGRPCGCVLRRICRAVVERALRIEEMADRPVQVCLLGGGGRRARPWVVYSRANEEFAADVQLIARRVLTERQWKIFLWHHLGRATWRACSRALGMDKGQFFHEVYRLEERLGRVFREIEPYALFPTREYFAVWRRR